MENRHSPETAGPDVPIGQIDQYELLEVLGGGGMGDVYRARHKFLVGQTVAIKKIRRDRTGNPTYVASFLREMKAISTLDHENIVRAFYAGKTVDGDYFLVMDCIDGLNLDEQVKSRGPLQLDQACDYIMQTARALERIHAADLIHRDIKPSNIMVTREGVISIIDLGLALLKEESSMVGQKWHTPHYSAPEQKMGDHHVTARADLYSLGCTLIFLLTGHHPDDHNPTSSLPDSIPKQVRSIIEKLTARNPKDRYACAGDAADDFEGFLIKDPPVTIAVHGTNGGVGKGTFISFMAQFLADSGASVAVIDFDLGAAGSTAHAQHWYHQRNPVFVKTVYDHFAPYAIGLRHHKVYTAPGLWDVTPSALATHNRGRIYMVPALDAENQTDKFNVIANIPHPREERLFRITNEIIARVRRAKPVRYIVIDCGADVNPIYSAAFAASSYGFVVTTPDPAFHQNIRHIINEHQRRSEEVRQLRPAGDEGTIGVVVNKITSSRDRETAQRLRPVGIIPFDPLVQSRSFEGEETDVALNSVGKDPLDAMAVDYELGFSDVGQAIRETLVATLTDKDIEKLPKESDRLRWWKQAPMAAKWQLDSLKFRAQTWAARIATAVTLILVGFSSTIAQVRAAGDYKTAWIVAVIAASICLIGTGIWLWQHESSRRLLRKIAGLPSGKSSQPPRLFMRLLEEPRRARLRKLHALVVDYLKQTSHSESGG